MWASSVVLNRMPARSNDLDLVEKLRKDAVATRVAVKEWLLSLVISPYPAVVFFHLRFE